MENIDKKVIGVLLTKIAITIIILGIFVLFSLIEPIFDFIVGGKGVAFAIFILAVTTSVVIYGLTKTKKVKSYLKNVKDEDFAFNNDDDDDDF